MLNEAEMYFPHVHMKFSLLLGLQEPFKRKIPRQVKNSRPSVQLIRVRD